MYTSDIPPIWCAAFQLTGVAAPPFVSQSGPAMCYDSLPGSLSTNWNPEPQGNSPANRLGYPSGLTSSMRDARSSWTAQTAAATSPQNVTHIGLGAGASSAFTSAPLLPGPEYQPQYERLPLQLGGLANFNFLPSSAGRVFYFLTFSIFWKRIRLIIMLQLKFVCSNATIYQIQ